MSKAQFLICLRNDAARASGCSPDDLAGLNIVSVLHDLYRDETQICWAHVERFILDADVFPT